MEKKQMPDDFPSMTVREVADLLQVTARTIFRYIKEERLEAHRMGPRQLRISPQAVKNFMCPGQAAKVSAGETQPLLKVAEASKILGMPVRTLVHHIGQGRLKASRQGRQWRIKADDLEAYRNSLIAEKTILPSMNGDDSRRG